MMMMMMMDDDENILRRIYLPTGLRIKNNYNIIHYVYFTNHLTHFVLRI